MPRAQFEASVLNWFEGTAPDLVALLKLGIRLMASTFAIVALSSTVLAIRTVLRTRVEARLRVEAILLAVALFTTALPLAVALSHSFDISRYSIDILPFTILWWCMGLIYLLRGLIHGIAARRLRRRDSRRTLVSVG